MSVTPTNTVAEGSRKSSFRGDIQGLRAVAVLAVILNHSIGEPSGGFLGVDIFFVISGFIITSLILREVERSGRVSLLSFYKRRVKRILPAATLVLGVTLLCSWAYFGSERVREIAGDALAATFFVSNWRFAAQGTDYWAQDASTSPLQHYWSLGVEEQFYLVWPLIIGVVALVLHRNRMLKPALALVLAVAVIGSLLWAARESTSAPMWAYFSTLTRVWELGVGALLALSTSLLLRLPQWARPYLAWLGILALAYSLLTVTEADGMPVPGALLVVAATALIIGAGTGAKSEVAVWPLSNRVSTYLGDISYSLYLWHLPVIVFLGPLFPSHERRFAVTVLAITTILSVASYHLVEDPIRRSRWLEKGGNRRSHAFTLAASIAVVSVIVASSLLALSPTQVSEASAAEQGTAPQSQAELSSLLDAALDVAQIPALNPDPGDSAATATDESREGCSTTDLQDPASCWYPNEGASRTALVMGDSTAIDLIPTVRAALGDGWNVRGATLTGCPQIPVRMNYPTDEGADRCDPHQADALELVSEMQPDVVFIRNLYTTVHQLKSGVTPEAGGAAEWALAMDALISGVKQNTDAVVVVQSPPRGTLLAECSLSGDPASCEYRPDSAYRLVAGAESAAARDTGALFVPTENWYCVDGVCPGFVESVPIKRDRTHTTKQYAEVLGPILSDQIEGFLNE